MNQGDRTWIFLLCSERSGSNLITALLNAHDQISGPATKHLLNPLSRNFYRYMPFDEEGWKAVIEDICTLFTADFSKWESTFTQEELLSNVQTGDLRGLIAYFYDKEAAGRPVSFVKEIKVHEFFPFLMAFFPGAHYLYQIRDPRDVALSWKKSTSHKGGVVASSLQWKTDQQKYLLFSHLPGIAQNLTMVAYEALVKNPKQVLLPFLTSIGLEWDVGLLNFHSNTQTIANALNQSAWENLSKPVLADNTNKYERELTPDEAKMIERITYFEMLALGYTPRFTWEELVVISEREIQEFHKRETEELPYRPTKGVIENMAAKQRFYQYHRSI